MMMEFGEMETCILTSWTSFIAIKCSFLIFMEMKLESICFLLKASINIRTLLFFMNIQFHFKHKKVLSFVIEIPFIVIGCHSWQQYICTNEKRHGNKTKTKRRRKSEEEDIEMCVDTHVKLHVLNTAAIHIYGHLMQRNRFNSHILHYWNSKLK